MNNPLINAQIPFDLGHRNALGREDFLIAPSNQDAVAWIDLWPEWPAPALVLYGPKSSGKTHLAAVWGEQSKAVFLSLNNINEHNMRDVTNGARNIVLGDCDDFIGNLEAEKTLFHLYNVFKEDGRSILITLQEPPVRRSFVLPDLASRLRAAPSVAIREPDDVLLGAVLVKLFNDRQLRVGADVINYILAHMERSFEAATQIVDAADKKALMEKRGVTLPLLRDVLAS